MTSTTYLIDEFAILERIAENLVKIRLFPFGRVVKNGIERLITPELAQRFRLPHFKPPVKLGSHAEETPAGGRYISLEVGNDGLYGLMQVTELGEKALGERHYGYHSPEVIWEDGYLEHPETGEPMYGPMIVGGALLHTPHLGEAAALFRVDPIHDNGGVPMSETMTVPVSWIDRLMGRGKEPEPEQEPAPKPPVQQEDYAAEYRAATAKVEELTAAIQQMRAEEAVARRVAHFAAALPNEPKDVHQLLADLDESQAEVVATRLRALSAQVAQQPDVDVGRPGSPEGLGVDPAQALNQTVLQYASEKGLDYNAAFAAVTAQNPDLFKAYEAEKEEIRARMRGDK